MELNASSTVEVVCGGSSKVKLTGAQVQVDVGKGECVATVATIFRWSEEEIEGYADGVGKSTRFEGHGKVGAVGRVQEVSD